MDKKNNDKKKLNQEKDNMIVDKNKRIELSQYVISFASATAKAQKYLSSKNEPMGIKEAEFKVNISTDLEINENEDVKLNVVSMSLEQKMVTDYKEHFGIEMRFVLVPNGLMNNSSNNGGY